MSRENPFSDTSSANKSVEGEGSMMKESVPEAKRKLQGLNLEGVVGSEEKLQAILSSHDSYSETYRIKPDGMFDVDSVERDGPNLGYKDTPEGLYRTADEIQKKHPEYKFNFETDPEGKWMKYTVSKTEKAK